MLKLKKFKLLPLFILFLLISAVFSIKAPSALAAGPKTAKFFILRNITVCNIDTQCLNFTLDDTEVAALRNQINDYQVEENGWLDGKMTVNPVIVEITANKNINMSPANGGWWIAPPDIKSTIESSITSNDDFVFVMHSTYDKTLHKKAAIGSCGLSYGANNGLGGAGYTWIPNSTPAEFFNCAEKKTIIHESLHQIDWALANIDGVGDIYNNTYTQSMCGNTNPADKFKWFPDPDQADKIPDFPACQSFYGNWGGYCNSILPEDCDYKFDEHLLVNHFPPSLDFTGNYCRDGVMDYSEGAVDEGAACNSGLTNKIVNGSFETQPVGTPWVLKTTSPASASIDAASGTDGTFSEKVLINNSDATDWHVQLQQSGISVTAGSNVYLTFWAKSATTKTARVTIQKAASPYTTYVSQSLSLTTSWQKFRVPFNPTTTENVLLAFNVGQDTTTTYLDGATLIEVPQNSVPTLPTNLVNNPSFENTGGSWLNPWVFTLTSPAVATVSQDSTTATAGTYSTKFNITTASTQGWHAQLQQTSIPVTNGTTYSITFWAKASSVRTIGFAIQKAASPYTVYLNPTLDLTTYWQPYTLSFTPGATENILTAFNVAKATGQVWIDNVAIR